MIGSFLAKRFLFSAAPPDLHPGAPLRFSKGLQEPRVLTGVKAVNSVFCLSGRLVLPVGTIPSARGRKRFSRSGQRIVRQRPQPGRGFPDSLSAPRQSCQFPQGAPSLLSRLKTEGPRPRSPLPWVPSAGRFSPFQQPRRIQNHEDRPRVVNQRPHHRVENPRDGKHDGDEIQRHGKGQVVFDRPQHPL